MNRICYFSNRITAPEGTFGSLKLKEAGMLIRDCNDLNFYYILGIFLLGSFVVAR